MDLRDALQSTQGRLTQYSVTDTQGALHSQWECILVRFSQALNRQMLQLIITMRRTHHVSCRLAEPLCVGDKTVHI